MANIGLAKPYVAKYSASGNTVTYSDGQTLGKAVECQIELDDTDPVKLYADDGVAESASAFSSGTLTLTIDELSLDDAAFILGADSTTVTTPSGTVLSYKGTATQPDLGFGIIVTKIAGGVYKYIGIILRHIKFAIPSGDYSTKGESIEFGTTELSATIMLDDAENPEWKKVGEFTSKANAEAWIKSELLIS